MQQKINATHSTIVELKIIQNFFMISLQNIMFKGKIKRVCREQ
jgi:hypothetical protein